MLLDYLLGNFSELLWKINVLNMCNVVDLFRIIVVSRSRWNSDEITDMYWNFSRIRKYWILKIRVG